MITTQEVMCRDQLVGLQIKLTPMLLETCCEVINKVPGRKEDLFWLGVDHVCHLLPGLLDGSFALQVAITLIRCAGAGDVGLQGQCPS